MARPTLEELLEDFRNLTEDKKQELAAFFKEVHSDSLWKEGVENGYDKQEKRAIFDQALMLGFVGGLGAVQNFLQRKEAKHEVRDESVDWERGGRI